jgi:hypothetical protein
LAPRHVVLDARVARHLRARGLRGFLLRSFREDGAALPEPVAAWLDAMDVLAADVGTVGTVGMPTRTKGETVTVEAAANVLGLKERRVRMMVATGQLDGRKVHGAWRIYAESLRDELDKRGTDDNLGPE